MAHSGHLVLPPDGLQMNNSLTVSGEIPVFHLPICFFHNLAKLIIFTRSGRTPCIFFLN